MQEKTQLNPKKATQKSEPGIQYFYPAYGMVGVATAVSFFMSSYRNDKPQANRPLKSDVDIPLEDMTPRQAR